MARTRSTGTQWDQRSARNNGIHRSQTKRSAEEEEAAAAAAARLYTGPSKFVGVTWSKPKGKWMSTTSTPHQNLSLKGVPLTDISLVFSVHCVRA